MNLSKGGEQIGVVAAKVVVKAPIGVYAKELAHDLYGQDFRIRELGSRTARRRKGCWSLSQSSTTQKTV
jgi:hypothetical protein